MTLACGEDDRPVGHPAVLEAPAISGGVAASGAGGTSCARDLAAQTPAPVRGALDDLGYGAIFDDACLEEQAERSGDPSVCEGVTVSSLRDRCVLRVAIASGHPLDCPASRTLEGRAPLCVALAARDRRLCTAAGVVDAAVCEAALGDPRGCDLLGGAERDACVARAADLRARVGGDVRTTPPLETSTTLTMADGTQRAIASAARGARISYRGCTRVLTLGEPERTRAPFAAPALALDIAAGAEAPFDVDLGALPGLSTSTLSISLDGLHVPSAAGTLTIRTLEATLGGVVEGSFHATLGPGRPTVDGIFTTFVRDVDPSPATCVPLDPAR